MSDVPLKWDITSALHYFFVELIVFYFSRNSVEKEATVDLYLKYFQEIRWSLTCFTTRTVNLS